MKKFLLWLSIFALIGSSAVVTASAAVKAGGTCKKVNSTTTVSGYKYTCIKSGKKLVWSKGVKVVVKTTPTPTPTPSPTPTATNANFDNNVYSDPKMLGTSIEKCKIQEISNQGNAKGDLASGFPFMNRFATYSKEIKMAFIPIDFSDLAGDANYKTRLGDQPKTLSDWYSSVSGGKLSVTWTIGNEWIRLPGTSADYAVPFSGSYPETANFWKKVLPIIDAKFDLTGFHVINFVLPSGQMIIKVSHS